MHEAISNRMQELAYERRKTVTEIARDGGLKQSTLSEIMNGRSKSPSLVNILKYCAGCNITLTEFFQSDFFNVIMSKEDIEKDFSKKKAPTN